jgi:hypothetical protein
MAGRVYCGLWSTVKPSIYKDLTSWNGLVNFTSWLGLKHQRPAYYRSSDTLPHITVMEYITCCTAAFQNLGFYFAYRGIC